MASGLIDIRSSPTGIGCTVLDLTVIGAETEDTINVDLVADEVLEERIPAVLLAANAIPAYQDYVGRSHMFEPESVGSLRASHSLEENELATELIAFSEEFYTHFNGFSPEDAGDRLEAHAFAIREADQSGPVILGTRVSSEQILFNVAGVQSVTNPAETDLLTAQFNINTGESARG